MDTTCTTIKTTRTTRPAKALRTDVVTEAEADGTTPAHDLSSAGAKNDTPPDAEGLLLKHGSSSSCAENICLLLQKCVVDPRLEAILSMEEGDVGGTDIVSNDGDGGYPWAKRRRRRRRYYAVLVGRKTGVFETWQGCWQQVYAYPGAIYKSFPDITQADRYLCKQTVLDW